MATDIAHGMPERIRKNIIQTVLFYLILFLFILPINKVKCRHSAVFKMTRSKFF